MSEMCDILFYAPMKPPDHPVPSGDRTMARLLMKALDRAGFKPEAISDFRSFEKNGDPASQNTIRREAEDEAHRIIARLRARPRLPRLWFSYHVYYKSPDWIGPLVCEALGIPYAVAEGSRAMKRAQSPWTTGHKGAEKALDAAAVIFAMTTRDEEALRAHAPTGQGIISLPPFVDFDDWPRPEQSASSNHPAELLTVAMMREGDKLQSYRQLTEALKKVTQPWTLDIIGDGPLRHEIEPWFAGADGTVRWHGEVTDKARLAAFYNDADLFVWPAVNEAYGMVLLEAQAFGCPVIAGNHGGVSAVVRDGETGVLIAPNDTEAFAAKIDGLLADRGRLRALGDNARQFIREERNLDSASRILSDALHPLITGSPA